MIRISLSLSKLAGLHWARPRAVGGGDSDVSQHQFKTVVKRATSRFCQNQTSVGSRPSEGFAVVFIERIQLSRNTNCRRKLRFEQ